MEEINLKELFQMFLKRWWILVLCAVISASAAYAYSYYYLVPIYESNTTLYVGKNIDQNGVGANDLMLGSALIADYHEIAKSKQVASQVIKELGLKYMSPGALAGRIGVTQRNGTRIIQISVSDTNPKMAMDIANKVAEVFKNKVIEIMQVENVQIIDEAELPRSPVSPDKKRNIIMGLVIGLAVGAGIVFLVEYLDNTVKTPEDVQKYLGLPVIGTIPVFQMKGKGNL